MNTNEDHNMPLSNDLNAIGEMVGRYGFNVVARALLASSDDWADLKKLRDLIDAGIKNGKVSGLPPYFSVNWEG